MEPEAIESLMRTGNLDAYIAVDALLAAIHRPAWMADAACRGMGPDLFFGERGWSSAPAKQVCASCPVRQPCLDYALELGDLDAQGLWGGTSQRERRAMRRDTDAA
jgi:WhiB family redox-sensing transcriptional regulator